MSLKKKRYEAARQHLVERGNAAPTHEQIQDQVKAEHVHTHHPHPRKQFSPTRKRRAKVKTP